MGPRVRADVYTVLHTAVHTGATRDGRGRMSAEWQKVGVGRRVRVFWGSSAVYCTVPPAVVWCSRVTIFSNSIVTVYLYTQLVNCVQLYKLFRKNAN